MDRPHVKPRIIHGNALDLPLEDASVDLVVTSPPYFGLRSYQDGGQHYDGQIGSEPTPAEFVDALIAATREMVRVLKPSGSIFVNLGDKYASSGPGSAKTNAPNFARHFKGGRTDNAGYEAADLTGFRHKSLIGIPWRYAIRCIDELGLILRAEIIWNKPNGLPESVTDRVRRSHEHWFHFTKSPRYFSAVDEIREPHEATKQGRSTEGWRPGPSGQNRGTEVGRTHDDGDPLRYFALSPLGKLPGSVWTIPTEPLRVPDHLGVDHFAAFPTEWPRRIIQGWSPREVCTACGQGRRPVVTRGASFLSAHPMPHPDLRKQRAKGRKHQDWKNAHPDHLTGYACACPDTTAPTTPGVVLDPFGGTGTTALVADVLGRHGVSVDLSRDYCRLAEWRTTDPGQRAKAARVEPPPPVLDGQLSLFGEPA